MQMLSSIPARLLYSIPAWDVQKFLGNAHVYMRVTMALLAAVFGAVALIWGFVLVVKGLMSSNGQPVPWVKAIALIIIGGAMDVASYSSLYSDIAGNMNKTITNMGNGTGQKE